MQNLISIDTKYIKRIFDLKGSEVDRLTKNIEKVSKLQALKDLDFKWMKKIDHDLIQVNPAHTELIEDALTKDLVMLADLGLMDYSLLLIIVDNSYKQADDREEIEKLFSEPKLIRKIIPSINGKYVYIIGIIDYLQTYNFKKAIEHKFKKIVHDDKASAVDPKLYAYRMKKFLSRHLLGLETTN